MKYILLGCLGLHALTIFSMNNDEVLDLREIARIYRKLVLEKTGDQPLGTKCRDDICGNMGIGLKGEDTRASFLCISRRWQLFEPAIRIFYSRFLKMGFFSKIGKITTKKLLQTNISPKAHPNFYQIKNYLNETYGPNSIKEPDITISLFDNFHFNSKPSYFAEYSGFLFRNKNNLASIRPVRKELKFLFREDNEAKEILIRINEINKILQQELSTLETILNANEETNVILSNLLAAKDLPASSLKTLKLILADKTITNNENRLIYYLKAKVPDLASILNHRDIVLNTIVPAPIDLFLLYCFYIFQEVKIHKKNKVAVNLLENFSEVDGLGITDILGSYCQNFIDKFGLDLHKNEIDSSKKNLKPKKSSKNNKNKSKPNKKPTNHLQKTKESHASNLEKFNVNEANKITLNINESVGIMPISMDHTEIAEEIVPDEILIDDSLDYYLDSLNDEQHTYNVKLLWDKGHRQLDRMARLLHRELAFEGNEGGSVSVALVPGPNDPYLVLATKYRRDKATIIEAIKQVVFYSKSYSEGLLNLHDDICGLKKDIKNWRTQIAKLEDNNRILGLENLEKIAREKLDGIKLYLAMNKDSDNNIVNSLKQILSNIQENNILVLENSFGYHSEFPVIHYLRENGLFLGHINHRGNKRPYQYIGGSMLNCGKCNSLIRGRPDIVGINNAYNHEQLLIFTGGYFAAGYDNYMVHQCAKDLNRGKPFFRIKNFLNQYCEDISKFPLGKIFIMRKADLSDSED